MVPQIGPAWVHSKSQELTNKPIWFQKRGPMRAPPILKMFLCEWAYAGTQVVPRRVQAGSVKFLDRPVIDLSRSQDGSDGEPIVSQDGLNSSPFWIQVALSEKNRDGSKSGPNLTCQGSLRIRAGTERVPRWVQVDPFKIQGGSEKGPTWFLDGPEWAHQ